MAHRRRRIRDGDDFTIEDETNDRVKIILPDRFEEPPIETQGEPWGWTKGPPYPRGWREDGRYDAN